MFSVQGPQTQFLNFKHHLVRILIIWKAQKDPKRGAVCGWFTKTLSNCISNLGQWREVIHRSVVLFHILYFHVSLCVETCLGSLTCGIRAKCLYLVRIYMFISLPLMCICSIYIYMSMSRLESGLFFLFLNFCGLVVIIQTFFGIDFCPFGFETLLFDYYWDFDIYVYIHTACLNFWKVIIWSGFANFYFF